MLFVQRIYVPPSAQEGLYEKCMYRYKSIEGKAKRAAGGNYRSSKFAVADRQTEESLKEARQFERFGQEPEHLMRLAGAADELADHYRRQDRLKEEIKELKNGTWQQNCRLKRKNLQAGLKKKNRRQED